MRRAVTIVVELFVVATFLVAAVYSWDAGTRTTVFAAVGEAPAFETVRFVPPWLVLAVLLTGFAAIVAVDAAGRVLTAGAPSPTMGDTRSGGSLEGSL